MSSSGTAQTTAPTAGRDRRSTRLATHQAVRPATARTGELMVRQEANPATDDDIVVVAR